MHERVVAARVIDEAKEKARGSISFVELEVGELAHLPADELKAMLKEMTEWTVEVTEKPALVACLCGYRGRPRVLEKNHSQTLYCCPECSAPSPEVMHGNEIVLLKVRDEFGVECI